MESRCWPTLGLILGLLTSTGIAQGPPRATPRPQQPATGAQPSSALISVVLLTGDEGVGLRAQRWSQVFDKMGIALTIKRAGFNEKPDITESKLGKFRQINVVGALDLDGRIRFPGRVFAEADGDKLAKWLGDLKTFGAQGSPQGQPLWGLTKPQFGQIFVALSKPVPVDVRDETLDKGLLAFALPTEFALVPSVVARKRMTARQGPLRQSFKGVAKGSALAALLSDMGLVFHPQRRPDGQLELGVYTSEESKENWPVGWPLKASAPETAPKMFAYVNVELEEIELDGVLDAAGEVVGLPILVDSAGLRSKQIDLATLKVSHPAKRTNWSIALKTLTGQAKARPELWLDEAGKPFVYVVPINAPTRPGAEAPVRAPGKDLPPR